MNKLSTRLDDLNLSLSIESKNRTSLVFLRQQYIFSLYEKHHGHRISFKKLHRSKLQFFFLLINSLSIKLFTEQTELLLFSFRNRRKHGILLLIACERGFGCSFVGSLKYPLRKMQFAASVAVLWSVPTVSHIYFENCPILSKYSVECT